MSKTMRAEMDSIITDQNFMELQQHGLRAEDWNLWFKPTVIRWNHVEGVTEIHCRTDFAAEEIANRYWRILTEAFGRRWRTVGFSGMRARMEDGSKPSNPIYGACRREPKGLHDLRDEILASLAKLDGMEANRSAEKRRDMPQPLNFSDVVPALRSLGQTMLARTEDQIAGRHP